MITSIREFKQVLNEDLSLNETEDVHISQIKSGDTVIHNGEIKTVSGTDLKSDKFMGTSLFGDTYNIGNKLVKRVKI